MYILKTNKNILHIEVIYPNCSLSLLTSNNSNAIRTPKIVTLITNNQLGKSLANNGYIGTFVSKPI